MKLQFLYEVDKIISNIPKNARIFYFQSHNKKVIELVIQNSTALKYHVGITQKTENLFKTLCEEGKCVNATKCYKKVNEMGYFHFTEKQEPNIIYLSDFEIFSREEDRIRFLKAFMDFAEESNKNVYLLISSSQNLIPSTFTDDVTLVYDKGFTEQDLYALLADEIRQEEAKRKQTYYTDDEIRQYAKLLTGLTERQVEHVFIKLKDSFCTQMREKLADHVNFERREEGKKDPLIEFIEVEEHLGVAGLGGYTEWLDERVSSFQNPKEFAQKGMPAPKGVMFCGVPGTGKTLMAKETARRLRVNLIKFNIGRLSSKEYGSSEAKMEHFLERVSANAPCVVLVDEVEKVFHDEMHEVKQQQLNKILDWMQNRTANVLIFMTANNIAKLPPELVRDERISGRFFAFMPTHDDLMAILWQKLLSSAKEQIFSATFCMEIQEKAKNRGKASPMDEVFNRIVKMEDGNFTTRTPFMTGANLNALIEMTNRALDKAGKLDSCGAKDYADQFVKCGRSVYFVPQGQSNMNDLVEMWFSGYEKQYQDVSAYTLLPFGCFTDGVFHNLPETNNAYDEYLQKILKEKIEETVKKTKQREKVFEKFSEEKEKN